MELKQQFCFREITRCEDTRIAGGGGKSMPTHMELLKRLKGARQLAGTVTERSDERILVCVVNGKTGAGQRHIEVLRGDNLPVSQMWACKHCLRALVVALKAWGMPLVGFVVGGVEVPEGFYTEPINGHLFAVLDGGSHG